MSKKSIIAREKKRIKLVNKYKNKRIDIKKNILNNNVSDNVKWKFIIKLQKLPKNSLPCRLRNRCILTGRPRGYIRMFGLSRIKFREIAMSGLIPGLKKSSW